MHVDENAAQLQQDKPAVICPVNFNRLTLGALRKYQYKFRLQMGAKDKPLIERADLIAAIEQHFVKELKVDQNDEIGKFLTLKREETHQHIRQGRNNNRATR